MLGALDFRDLVFGVLGRQKRLALELGDTFTLRTEFVLLLGDDDAQALVFSFEFEARRWHASHAARNSARFKEVRERNLA